MNTSSQHIDLADYYFGFLKNLNPDSKLDLISKLSQSLKKKDDVSDTSFLCNRFLERINQKKLLTKLLLK